MEVQIKDAWQSHLSGMFVSLSGSWPARNSTSSLSWHANKLSFSRKLSATTNSNKALSYLYRRVKIERRVSRLPNSPNWYV